MAIKIDHDVPLLRVHGNTKFPWDRMKPGDSFFVEGYRTSGSRGRSGKHMSFDGAKKQHPGSTWKARDVEENGLSGVRVWRVT